MSNKPTLLHWYPRDPEKAIARTAHLSPEAYTAFSRLRDHAWLASSRGDPACTLPTDDEELARLSGLGKAWTKVAEKVRGLFALDGGRLLDSELYALWKQQQAQYTKRKDAGDKGREERKRRKQSKRESDSLGESLSVGIANNIANGNASAKPWQQEQELEGAEERGPSGPSVRSAPASARALGAEAPRFADASGSDAAHEDSPDLELVDGGVPGEEPIGRARLDAIGRALDDAYATGLRGAVAKWRAEHPETYAEHEAAERALQGIARAKMLSDLGQRVLDEAVIERVRRANGWPTQDEWVAEKRRRGELAEVEGAA